MQGWQCSGFVVVALGHAVVVLVVVRCCVKLLGLTVSLAPAPRHPFDRGLKPHRSGSFDLMCQKRATLSDCMETCLAAQRRRPFGCAPPFAAPHGFVSMRPAPRGGWLPGAGCEVPGSRAIDPSENQDPIGFPPFMVKHRKKSIGFPKGFLHYKTRSTNF